MEPTRPFHFFEEVEEVTIIANLREQAPRVLGGRGVDRKKGVNARQPRDERPEERSDHVDRSLIKVDSALAADPVVESVVGLFQSVQISIEEIGVAAERPAPADDPDGVFEARLVGVPQRPLKFADDTLQIVPRSAVLLGQLRRRDDALRALLQIEGLLAAKFEQCAQGLPQEIGDDLALHLSPPRQLPSSLAKKTLGPFSVGTEAQEVVPQILGGRHDGGS